MTIEPVNGGLREPQPALSLSKGGAKSDGAPEAGQYQLRVTNKFGDQVSTPPGQRHCDLSQAPAAPKHANGDRSAIEHALAAQDAGGLYEYFRSHAPEMDYDRLRGFVDELAASTAEAAPKLGIDALTLCLDRRCVTGQKKRSSVLTIVRGGLGRIFEAQPLCDRQGDGHALCRVNLDLVKKGMALRGPQGEENTLLIDARGFPPEGPSCDATLAVKAYQLGWRNLVHYNTRGTRFHAVGFGSNTAGLRIDCYDNPGDYLASGMDGLEVHVHGYAQDQVGQIVKSGKLVVHGDVGQTFLYGAKGGECYVLGNAAGRPMINAVGKPRVVINGTALDYLAESFMAGDPLAGGGFAILNGIRLSADGKIIPLDLPYPGSNLLSLASGGAIYVRDPHRTLVDQQLNGGAYRPLGSADWALIRPYLEENERLFGIRIEQDLLTVDGALQSPAQVYRKVMPASAAKALAEEDEDEGVGE